MSALAQQFRQRADTCWRAGLFEMATEYHTRALIEEATQYLENHVEEPAQDKRSDFLNNFPKAVEERCASLAQHSQRSSQSIGEEAHPA